MRESRRREDQTAGRGDFTPLEWEVVCEAPVYAGLIVAAAQRGGFFWEAISIARSFSVVRAQHGENRLLDDIVAERPHVEHTRFRSASEVRTHGLEHIRAAVKLVEEKADPADLSAFVQFGLDVAGRVACAYRETKAPISEAEKRALMEVAAAFGQTQNA